MAEEAVKTALTTPEVESAPEVQPAPDKEDAVSENGAASAKIQSEPEIQVQPVGKEPKNGEYRSEINGVEVDFELQYRDRETDMKDIAKRVTQDYVKRGNDASKIGLIQVYLKPTDYTAYYVINNSYEGKIPLFE
ncbi:MAG: hypothetical protein K2O40_12240 [Lachnospiraceae bacterium]|nr:hypothetical protein [Lachnospiraceae bacterium]